MFQELGYFDEASLRQDDILIGLRLLKAVPSTDPADPWKFAGIASDESKDVEGDKILRKALDVSYAQRRGYVNWDHGRDPGDQIGFLTKCEVLSQPRIEELKKTYPSVSDTATVYVEGELYKHMPKAEQTFQLLKSVPEGQVGPGLSLDGALARDRTSGGVVKAFVRGVAITPVPAHPATIARLRKSLSAYATLAEADGALPADLPQAVAELVVEKLRKAATDPTATGMDFDQAVLFVLRKRPHWTYELASKLVKYTMQNLG